MSGPVCPDHGPIDGLGVCYVDGCGFDARGEKETTVHVAGASEEEIQRQIVDYLHATGFHVVDTSQGYRPDGSTRITAGLSDLIVFGPGRVCFVEVKRPGKKPTEDQKRFARWCEEAGVEWTVWTSLKDARAWHEERGRAA